MPPKNPKIERQKEVKGPLGRRVAAEKTEREAMAAALEAINATQGQAINQNAGNLADFERAHVTGVESTHAAIGERLRALENFQANHTGPNSPHEAITDRLAALETFRNRPTGFAGTTDFATTRGHTH